MSTLVATLPTTTSGTVAPHRLLAAPREPLTDYQRAGGYSAAAWAHTPTELLAAITASELRGRGGAGFPAGIKWRAVAEGRGRKVVVINAAESEPASHKDRTLFLGRPHLIIEGALLAAHAVEAREVILYTHDRTVAAVAEQAIAELTRAGLRLPRWRTVIAPPGYVAGESSAAVNFINGKGAKPTLKPPHATERGVGGRPTLVQNVETLANVPLIARDGAYAFRAVGSADYPGTILITLGGAVDRPGVYEVPSGTPLATVLTECGGGMPWGVQALLPGGFFGGWLGPAALYDGTALTPTSLRAAGAELGSAAIVVVPEGVCGLWQAIHLLRFFAAESARQCGPCTFGIPAMAEALERIARGMAEPDDLPRLRRYAERMLPHRGACGHLDGAAHSARSALTVFAAEIETHRQHGGCGRPEGCILPGLSGHPVA